MISVGEGEKRWVPRAHLRLILPPWWEEWDLSVTRSSPSVTSFHRLVTSAIPALVPSRSMTASSTSMLLNPIDDHAGDESDDELRREDITFSVAADTGPLTPGVNLTKYILAAIG